MRRAAVEETALGDVSKPFGSDDDLVSQKVANYIYTKEKTRKRKKLATLVLHHHLFPSNMDASELHFIYIDFYQNVAKMMFQGKRGSRMMLKIMVLLYRIYNAQLTIYRQHSTAHQSTQEQEQEQTETVEQPNTANQTTAKQIQSNCKI